MTCSQMQSILCKSGAIGIFSILLDWPKAQCLRGDGERIRTSDRRLRRPFQPFLSTLAKHLKSQNSFQLSNTCVSFSSAIKCISALPISEVSGANLVQSTRLNSRHIFKQFIIEIIKHSAIIPQQLGFNKGERHGQEIYRYE